MAPQLGAGNSKRLPSGFSRKLSSWIQNRHLGSRPWAARKGWMLDFLGKVAIVRGASRTRRVQLTEGLASADNEFQSWDAAYLLTAPRTRHQMAKYLVWLPWIWPVVSLLRVRGVAWKGCWLGKMVHMARLVQLALKGSMGDALPQRIRSGLRWRLADNNDLGHWICNTAQSGLPSPSTLSHGRTAGQVEPLAKLRLRIHLVPALLSPEPWVQSQINTFFWVRLQRLAESESGIPAYRLHQHLNIRGVVTRKPSAYAVPSEEAPRRNNLYHSSNWIAVSPRLDRWRYWPLD